VLVFSGQLMPAVVIFLVAAVVDPEDNTLN
jgi:hypothetical protein